MRPLLVLAFGLIVAVAVGLHNAAPQDPPDPDDKPAPLEKVKLVLDTGGHTGQVIRLAFSKDAKVLYSVSRDATVRVWDVTSGACLRVWRLSAQTIEGAAFSSDRNSVALAVIRSDVKERRILLLNVRTGKIDRALALAGFQAVTSLAWSPDGKLLACGRGGGMLQLFDPLDGRHLKNASEGEGGSVEVAFSPDGKLLASGSRQKIHVWHVPEMRLQATFETLAFHCLAWPRAELLAVGGKGIQFWDPRSTKMLTSFLKVGSIHALAFSPDDKTFLSAGASGITSTSTSRVEIREAASGKRLLQLDNKTTGVPHPMEAVYSPDGKMIATSYGPEQAIFLHRAWGTSEPGLEVMRLAGKGGATDQVAFSKEGPIIAWEQANKARAFDLANLESVARPLALEPSEKKVPWKGGFVFGIGNQIGSKGASVPVSMNQSGHTDRLTNLSMAPNGKHLASGSLDQTVRIWQPGRRKPVLSLFSAGADWVAWSPEGYYAASPGGERLMGWQVDEGVDKLASFYPAQRFRQAFYRPDVISKLLETSLEETFTRIEPKKKGGPLTIEKDLARLLPPRAVIDGPSERRISKPQLQVVARADKNNQQPIEDMILFLNDRPFEKPRKVAAADQAVTWDVKLEPGTHRLRVLARGKLSGGASPEIEVTYAPEVPIKVGGPRLLMLSVGINEYVDQDLRLKCPVNDAVDLPKTFQERAPFGEVLVKVKTNEQATQKGIREGLEWLKAEAKPKDLVVIFFAGHGRVHPPTKEFYLMPQEATIDNLPDKGLSGKELKDAVVEIAARRVLLLLDACHAGAIGANGLTKTLADDDVGIAVMCAAQGKEVARERGRYGLFAKALIDGLEGGAKNDAPRSKLDGLVYLHHLEQHVIDKVQEWSDDQQHPVSARPPSISSSAFVLARPR